MAVGDARNGGCQLPCASHDGGRSWATTAEDLMPPELRYCVHRNTGSYIAPAFARDGTLYVALSGTPADDHPNGPMTAIVARTTNLGKTSEASTVATPRSDITFTNADGRVETNLIEQHRYAAFVARTATAAPRIRYADVYMASSTDGGKTWSPNIRVTDRSIDTTVGVTFSNFGLRGPIGIASTNGAAYVVWPDSRAGNAELQSEDAYLTRVRFDADLAGSAGGDGNEAAWALGGAGVALAAAGALLAVGVLTGRRRKVLPAKS